MDLTQITGYRTNEDHTQTLAWLPNEQGTVECVHAAPACCDACVEADARLIRSPDTENVVIGYWSPLRVREGRTVRWVD